MIFISQLITGIFVPFLGTAVGAAGVFFLKKNISSVFTDVLSAFAAGIMVAASVWSLIIPAVEYSYYLGLWAFMPAATGFMAGIFFMIILGDISKAIIRNKEHMRKLGTTVLAVTIHNFPEGMAVGMIYAACIAGKDGVSFASAFILATGIAIQNIPEGAIISMPLHTQGVSKVKAFSLGALSGIVEPIGAILTIFVAESVAVLLPYLLSFAAGTMIFVVTEQLIPDIKSYGRVPVRGVSFALGFILMMSLDVTLS